MFNKLKMISIPVLSVVLGFIAGAIIMLVSGYDPAAGYSAMVTGIVGDSFNLGESVRQIIPYILAGLAVAFAFRTGLFNIGVEGQLIVGWLASVWVGITFDLPAIIHLPLAVLAGGLAGALWAFIPGILKAKFRVHEVIVSIMLNYTALHVTNYIINNVLTDKMDKTGVIKDTASLRSPFFESITDGSRMHWGIFVAIICVFIMYFILEKTTTGFELKAVGFNQHASEYSGMSVNKNIVLSMVISGSFAGLAGAMEGLGTFGYAAIKTGFTGIGFDGIAVALLGGNTAIGVVFAAILFGGLKAGALNMPYEAGIPSEIVDIVIALIIFFVASSYFIRYIIGRITKKGVK
ncbi:ABC transporter permease [Peribacillus psychrosaccharolyticus]|uniref:ABC transporter permease n=2 Tax=Peribacillus psychrosaccharolyticus TaxID=1407 RepID=A0A974NPJ5_PERPY|nr:ABC transporter permease [Peribacillus psychrosaccharolyticus]MEC2053868.1 ABC transporter permease [Peribacillus psychrosaccharolyticus]MED3742518.1 ABC transporter permease [Peribacillus psychrosaccharolyticus]QQT01470.1 ABC transporter permease [Peribacillus psychrosaccharolyticus]